MVEGVAEAWVVEVAMSYCQKSWWHQQMQESQPQRRPLEESGESRPQLQHLWHPRSSVQAK